ncbi:hypothetical protein KVT40_002827 [Elsinoe batatas]|uniref:Uncharacterized protein n=1 Tax=Elsinoe batatas TaxID=2601811 RepID=A0A8K0L4R5_9PEZI|nr:hypothetical protein KVT40_002827 [Elsinoe batatas]
MPQAEIKSSSTVSVTSSASSSGSVQGLKTKTPGQGKEWKEGYGNEMHEHTEPDSARHLRHNTLSITPVVLPTHPRYSNDSDRPSPPFRPSNLHPEDPPEELRAPINSTRHRSPPSPLDGFMDSSIRSVDDYWAKMQTRGRPPPEAAKIIHKRKAKRGGKNILQGAKEVVDAVGGMVDVQRWKLKRAGKRAGRAVKRVGVKVRDAGRRESYVSYTGSNG